MTPLHVDRIVRGYWHALPEDERAAIEAAVPEGHVLRIVAGHRDKPGTASVRLLQVVEGGAYRLIAETRGRLTAHMCWYVLRPTVVTVGADGFIESMEVAG